MLICVDMSRRTRPQGYQIKREPSNQSELYWDEIVWPPQHEDEMSLYIKRVLSRQLSTICDINNPEPNLASTDKLQSDLLSDGNNINAPSGVTDKGEDIINRRLKLVCVTQ